MNPIFEHEGWHIFHIDDCGETFFVGAKTPADALMFYLEGVSSYYEGGEMSTRAIRQKPAMVERLYVMAMHSHVREH